MNAINFNKLFSLSDFTKNIIENGINNKIASYLTTDAKDIPTNAKINDKFVLLRKSESDNTNKNMNNEYPCPSSEFNNNLGSSTKIKQPNRAI